jgi:hypothetical protein
VKMLSNSLKSRTTGPNRPVRFTSKLVRRPAPASVLFASPRRP